MVCTYTILQSGFFVMTSLKKVSPMKLNPIVHSILLAHARLIANIYGIE